MGTLQNIKNDGPINWTRLKFAIRRDSAIKWLLLNNVRVGRSLSWLYCDMPKSGSSSVRRALWQFEHLRDPDRVSPVPERGDLYNLNRPYGRDEGAPWLEPRHYHRIDLKKIEKATSIRNPFARIVSAYRHQILRGSEIGEWMDIDGGTPRPGYSPHYEVFCKMAGVEPGERVSFGDFVDGLAEVPGLLVADPHWRPQTDRLDGCPFTFQRWLAVESMDKDLGNFIAFLSDEPPAIERVDAHSAKGDDSELTPHLCYKIVKLYRRDFDELGYSTDPEQRFCPPYPG